MREGNNYSPHSLSLSLSFKFCGQLQLMWLCLWLIQSAQWLLPSSPPNSTPPLTVRTSDKVLYFSFTRALLPIVQCTCLTRAHPRLSLCWSQRALSWSPQRPLHPPPPLRGSGREGQLPPHSTSRRLHRYVSSNISIHPPPYNALC